MVLLIAGLIAASASALLTGCAPPPAVEGPQRIEPTEQRYASDAERAGHDPVAFLREVEERVAKLDRYRLTFYRQERHGLPPSLGTMEEIEAAFRAEPFSVKFDWHDENMPYYESLYVEGKHDNKLIVRERKGALPFLPPTTRVMDVMFPVKIGKSKNPITDFGLARMVRRTLLPFEDPEVAKVMTIEYQGLVNLEPIDRPVHHIRIERPEMEGYQYTRQDFYVDAETLLPAGTDLYLPGEVLDVRYRYTNVRPDDELTDADFMLEKNTSTTQPANKQRS